MRMSQGGLRPPWLIYQYHAKLDYIKSSFGSTIYFLISRVFRALSHHFHVRKTFLNKFTVIDVIYDVMYNERKDRDINQSNWSI